MEIFYNNITIFLGLYEGKYFAEYIKAKPAFTFERNEIKQFMISVRRF